MRVFLAVFSLMTASCDAMIIQQYNQQPDVRFAIDVGELSAAEICKRIEQASNDLKIDSQCAEIPTQREYRVVTFGMSEFGFAIQGGIAFDPEILRGGAYLRKESGDKHLQRAKEAVSAIEDIFE